MSAKGRGGGGDELANTHKTGNSLCTVNGKITLFFCFLYILIELSDTWFVKVTKARSASGNCCYAFASKNIFGHRMCHMTRFALCMLMVIPVV
jgi:hypothetical protein